MYFGFNIKAVDSTKDVSVKVRTNQTDIYTLKTYDSYIAKFSVEADATDKNHQYIFFIDEAEHKEGIEIEFKIPKDSEIVLSNIKYENAYNDDKKAFRIWTQKDHIENKGYIYGIVNSDNSVDYVYKFTSNSSYKNDYLGWEISARYFFIPSQSGDYIANINMTDTSDVQFDIEENYDPYKTIPFNYGNSSNQVNNSALTTGENRIKFTVTPQEAGKGICFKFRVPKENLDDYEHHIKFSSLAVQKQN